MKGRDTMKKFFNITRLCVFNRHYKKYTSTWKDFSNNKIFDVIV